MQKYKKQNNTKQKDILNMYKIEKHLAPPWHYSDIFSCLRVVKRTNCQTITLAKPLAHMLRYALMKAESLEAWGKKNIKQQSEVPTDPHGEGRTRKIKFGGIHYVDGSQKQLF